MRIAGITKGSYVNGPGRRNILHVQGCTIGCPGCFNKETWPKGGGTEIDPAEAAIELLKGNPDGISISGGEPMEQWESVRKVLQICLMIQPSLSTLIFTGWTREQLERSGRLREMSEPYDTNEKDALVDLVIAGPYIEKLACKYSFISSTNQEIIRPISIDTNTAKEREELDDLPIVEVHCEDGQVKILGFPDTPILEALKENL